MVLHLFDMVKKLDKHSTWSWAISFKPQNYLGRLDQVILGVPSDPAVCDLMVSWDLYGYSRQHK